MISTDKKTAQQQVTFDLSGWPLESITELFLRHRELDREVFSGPQGDCMVASAHERGFDLAPAPMSVRPTAMNVLSAPKTGWTMQAYEMLLDRLRFKGHTKYAELLEAAVEMKGSLDRESVYRVMGWEDSRQMKGFTRPYRSAVSYLIEEGLLPDEAVIPIDTEYDEEISGYQKSIGVVVAAEVLRQAGVDFG